MDDDEWKEFIKTSRWHSSLLLSSTQQPSSSDGAHSPNPRFLLTKNPISTTHALNSVLQFQRPDHKYPDAALESLVQPAFSGNLHSLHSCALMLSFHGVRSGLAVDRFLVLAFKQFLRSSLDVSVRQVMISSCASVAGLLSPGVFSSSSGGFKKDLIKSWRSDGSYLSVGYLHFLLQFLQSPAFMSVDDGESVGVRKAFWGDLDVIIRNVLASLDISEGRSVVERQASYGLLAHMLSMASFEPERAELVFKKQLAEYLACMYQRDAGIDGVNMQLLLALVPENRQRRRILLPFTILASYMVKYSLRRNIIVAAVETFRVMMLQLGTVVVRENLLMFLQFYTDLACNPRIDHLITTPGSREGWMEMSMLRRELISHLFQDTISKRLLAGSSLEHIHSVFVVGTLEKFTRLLSSTAAAARFTLSNYVISTFTFILHQLGSILVELGKIGNISTGLADDSRNLLDTMLEIWTIIAEAGSRVEINHFPTEFGATFAFVVRTLIVANCSNNLGILAKVLNLFSSQLQAFPQSESVDPTFIDRNIFTAQTLLSTIPVISFCAIHVNDVMLTQLSQLATTYIQSSMKVIDEMINRKTGNMTFFWRQSASFSWIGWNLIGALTSLDFGFVKSHLPQWLLMWQTFMVKITGTSEPVKSGLSAEYVTWIVITRESALTAMWNLMIHHPDACTAEVSKRIVSGVVATLSTIHGFPANFSKLFHSSHKYRASRVHHFHHSIIRNAFKSPSVSSLSSSTSIASNIVPSAQFIRSFPAASNLPQSLDILFSMTLYDRPRTHLMLLKKRAFDILSLSQVSPHNYSDNHVLLTRDLMETVCGNYLTVGTSTDPSKVASMYQIDDSTPEFASDIDEYSGLTSFLRGVDVDVRRTSVVKESDSAYKSETDKPPQDPSLCQRAWISDVLKKSEGPGPADLVETDRLSHWVEGNIENDLAMLWSAMAPTISQSSSLFDGNSAEPPLMECEAAKLYLPRPLATATALVDSSIKFFGTLFLSLNETHQEMLVEQMLKTIRLIRNHYMIINSNNSSIEVKDAVTKRLVKVQVNTLSALIAIFYSLAKLNLDGTLHLNNRLPHLIQEICYSCWGSFYAPVRSLASQLIALLVRTMSSLTDGKGMTGAQYVHQMINHSLETLSGTSKDPFTRAGSVLTLGAILQAMGNFSLTPTLLRTILSAMTALIMDAHVTVHTWALYSYFLAFDACAVNWMSLLGGKEVANMTLSICYSVIASDSHNSSSVVFNSDSKRAIYGLNPAIACPYRITLCILHSLLGAFGPELAMPSGLLATEGVLSIVTYIENELLELYRPLMPPVTTLANEDSVVAAASPKIQLQLKFSPFSNIIGGGDASTFIVPQSYLTFISPFSYTFVEMVNCLQSLITFNPTKSLPISTLMKVQVTASPSSSVSSPLSVVRVVSRLLWSAMAFKESERNSWSFFCLDHVLYLIDFVFKHENVINAGGHSGSLFDDPFLVVKGDPWHEMVSGETQLFNLVTKWCHEDIIERERGNRWISLAERIVNRKTIMGKVLEITDSAAKNIVTSANVEVSASSEPTGDPQGDGGEDDADSEGEENDAEVTFDADAGENQSVSSHMENLKITSLGFQGASAPTSPGGAAGVPSANDLKSFVSERIRFSISSSPLISGRTIRLSIRMTVFVLRIMFSVSAKQPVQWDYQKALLRQKELRALTHNLDETVKFFDNDANMEWTLPVILKLNSIIRIGFAASSNSYNDEFVRIAGLNLLKAVIELFSAVRDPHMSSASILEQYQVQFVTGISLPMSLDGSPNNVSMGIHLYPSLQCFACHLSALYVSSGISKDSRSISRIFKTLEEYVAYFVGAGIQQKSRVRANTEVLVKVSAIAAWASIYNFSCESSVLDILKIATPLIGGLFPLWLAFVVEFFGMKISSAPATRDIILKRPSDNFLAERRRSIQNYVSYGIKSTSIWHYTLHWTPIMFGIGHVLELSDDLAVNSIRSCATSNVLAVVLAECVESLLEWASAPLSAPSKKPVAAMKIIESIMKSSYSEHYYFDKTVAIEVLEISERCVFKEVIENSAEFLLQNLMMRIIETLLQSHPESLKKIDVAIDGDELSFDFFFVVLKLLVSRCRYLVDIIDKSAAGGLKLLGSLEKSLELICFVFLIAKSDDARMNAFVMATSCITECFLRDFILDAIGLKLVQFLLVIFTALERLLNESGDGDFNLEAFAVAAILSLLNLPVSKMSLAAISSILARCPLLVWQNAKTLLEPICRYFFAATEVISSDSNQVELLGPALSNCCSTLLTQHAEKSQTCIRFLFAVKPVEPRAIAFVANVLLDAISHLPTERPVQNSVCVLIWIQIVHPNLSAEVTGLRRLLAHEIFRFASREPELFKESMNALKLLRPELSPDFEACIREYISSNIASNNSSSISASATTTRTSLLSGEESVTTQRPKIELKLKF